MSAACPRCGLAVTGSALALCPRCLLHEEPEPLPAAPPGLTVEDEIGRGGMGRVFRGRHQRLGRAVAVKFLPPELAADPSFEARFEREARALAHLAHPHIVGVHDFGTASDGQSYLVMELVAGGTLAERIPVDEKTAIDVAVQLCDALAYAHARGVVHRDVKPENVLLTEDGRVKLGDFGIARMTEPPADGPPVTRASLVLGTPSYMAPEARAGAAPDPRMDVYAVGVLLRALVTGGRGSAGTPPPGLAAVIARATATEPERRPSAGALRDELMALRRPGRASPGERLPPDEESWERAVALTLAGATAVALYAFLVSFTPRVLAAADNLPLVSFGVKELSDGKVFTQARFETWPTLAAAAAFAVALAAYGLLRRHWRHAGFERETPEVPLPQGRAVFKLGVLMMGLFAGRMLLMRTPARSVAPYLPVLGGVLELVMLYWVWLAVLESRRTGRLLRREAWLWVGVVLSLVPPGVSFFRVLAGHAP